MSHVSRPLSSFFCLLPVVFGALSLWAEPEFQPVPSGGYRWFETMMKTADGVELYTYGVVPTNGVKCPVIVTRTPYDGHRLDKGAAKWAEGAGASYGLRRGYARVVQQCRGSSRSTGVRVPYVDERRDSLATLAFVRTLPCYNGEIFIEGGSYLSSVHWAYLDDCPADVKGAVLNIQCADRYPVVMHNGFPKIGLHINWYAGQYKSNVDGFARHREVSPAEIPFCDFTKRFFGDGREGPLAGLDDIISHPRPEDPFWRTPGGAGGEYRRAFVDSKIPILMTTGWFDIYADAMCDQWREASPARRANCALVIDAFDHGGKRSGEATNRTSVVCFPGGSRHDAGVSVRSLDWFDYVRGLKPAPAQVEVGGVTWYALWENAWHRAKDVPAGEKALTLVPQGVAERRYRYDPRRPAKFPVGCGLGFGNISPMPKPDFRDDVVTYIFDPVAETIDVAGRMKVALAVKSDCDDTAFYVRVSVKKAGTNVFYGLRESIKALTWDDGDYTPGMVRTLRFELADLAFRLGPGDVLRLDVSSSNAAMFAPHTNVKGLQAFIRNPKVANNTVYAEGSSLILPILSGDDADFTVEHRVLARFADKIGGADGVDFRVGGDTARPEGFTIRSENGRTIIEAPTRRARLYGLGRHLREWTFRGSDAPVQSVRGIYFATHFGNWYDCATERELREYVEELALWGCNQVRVWLDMHDYEGADDPRAIAKASRLKTILEIVRDCGLEPSLLVLANEAFANSPEGLRADWRGGQNGYDRNLAGHYHVELCPSKPGGLELILKEREAVLDLFTDASVGTVCIFPYDQGGCTCAACAPWGANGLFRILPPLSALIRRKLPGCQVEIGTWYFDHFGALDEWKGFCNRADEVRRCADLLSVERLDWLAKGNPIGLPTTSMSEISMWRMLPWGGFGANPCPKRFADYVRKGTGVLAGSRPYSEGIYEDLNKVLFLQFGWNPSLDWRRIVGEYAAFHFGAADEKVVETVSLLEDEQSHTAKVVQDKCRFSMYDCSGVDAKRPFSVVFDGHRPDLVKARRAHDLLEAYERKMSEPLRSSWRWRILKLRACIDVRLAEGMELSAPDLQTAFDELAKIYRVGECTEPFLTPPGTMLHPGTRRTGEL